MAQRCGYRRLRQSRLDAAPPLEVYALQAQGSRFVFAEPRDFAVRLFESSDDPLSVAVPRWCCDRQTAFAEMFFRKQTELFGLFFDLNSGTFLAAGITHGPVFRAINKTGRVWGDGMSPKVLWDVVRAAAARADIDKLA